MINNNFEKGLGRPLTISIIALALVAFGVIYLYVRQQEQKAEELQMAVMEKKEDAMMEKKEGEVMMEKEGETMMKKEEGTMMQKYAGTVLAGKSAPILDFNKTDYDTVLKTDKLIVLYFYANWCPICRAEIPHLYAAFNELTTDAVVGVRVSYNDSDTDDNERNLAREFGVAYQHTKVFLKNGQRILKAPDSWNKDRYLSEINKALAQ